MKKIGPFGKVGALWTSLISRDPQPSTLREFHLALSAVHVCFKIRANISLAESLAYLVGCVPHGMASRIDFLPYTPKHSFNQKKKKNSKKNNNKGRNKYKPSFFQCIGFVKSLFWDGTLDNYIRLTYFTCKNIFHKFKLFDDWSDVWYMSRMTWNLFLRIFYFPMDSWIW